jgi:hypothetical protein
MTPAAELICRFILERSQRDSPEQRAALYRAAASTLIGSDSGNTCFDRFTQLADDIDEIERRTHQLRLDFGVEQTGTDGRTAADFVRRTDALCRRLGVSLVEVADLIGISKATIFAYRNGSQRISHKSWRLLREAEKNNPE